MTTTNPNSHEPLPESQPTNTGNEKSAGGGQSPEKRGPGHMHEDDTGHKRSGGDVERDSPENAEESGDTRRGGHSHSNKDEEESGGRSRQWPGGSRKML